MKLLQEAYSQEKYLDFLVKTFNFSKPLSSGSTDSHEPERLGFITTADDKKLPVFEVHINPEIQLARNRVYLRTLVVKLVTQEASDGALAVYVDKENRQWRFSFIALEPNFNKSGDLIMQETASKRFTYLLGKNTQTRTAQERFSLLNKGSTLEDLKTAFAVEKLSQEFYSKLYKWYEKAQRLVTFPNDEKAENHIQTSLIRLLTRLLFVWFLKEKNLIKPDLFVFKKLQNLIDYDKDSSFYKAILQNLFFATLNHEIDDRSFRRTTDGEPNSTNYLASSVYRYQNYFKEQDEDKIKDLFAQTPFLNGGLFECLDRYRTEEEEQEYNADKSIRPTRSAIRMDGFSDRSDNELVFDNKLFFSLNTEDDLGLIDLFNQYQFTVEESTPLDIEVALDPELLGKVFENLLASYNPETGEQARKATGSFYTPREIVSYMVDESLKQHFTTHTDLTNPQIESLFIEDDNDLDKEKNETVIEVIEAIDNLKILDPAVGSGAYPMGILQRLVFILEKIDPENKHFKQQQLNKAKPMEGTIKEESIKAIEKVFSAENQYHAYGKKLMLIENAIYGVDIQPIAIQICKLRFFISLTIEQKPNSDKTNNYGIRPLPNLDTKFIVANSLLSLGKVELPQDDLFDRDIKDLQKKLADIRHDYFSAKTLSTKQDRREEDKEIREKMLAELIDSGVTSEIEESMKKIVAWDLYNQNAIADWFDPEWMFGVKKGFDIVIGNPPYIRQESIKEFKPQFKLDYKVFTGRADIYTYFYEKGFNLLSENGHLCYITSNKWMRVKYGEKLRHFFKNQTQLKQIIDFEGEQIFKNATVDTNILLCGKMLNQQQNFTYAKQLPTKNCPLFTMLVADLSDDAYTLQPPEILALKKKIEQIGTPLKDWDVNINYGIKTGFNEAFIIDTATKEELIAQDPKSAEIIKPILRGRDIRAYEANWAGLWIILAKYQSNKYLKKEYPGVYSRLNQYKEKLQKRGQCRYGGKGNRGQHHWLELDNNPSDNYLAEFSKEKIVWQRVTKEAMFCLIEPDIFIQDSMAFITTDANAAYLMAVLNSKLIKLFVEIFVHKYGNTGYLLSNQYVERLPIPKISKTEQKPFIDLVNKILEAKQQNQDTATLENKIDKLVYQLYKITADEISIIENRK